MFCAVHHQARQVLFVAYSTSYWGFFGKIRVIRSHDQFHCSKNPSLVSLQVTGDLFIGLGIAETEESLGILLATSAPETLMSAIESGTIQLKM